MEDLIILLTPYLPTITAIGSTIVLIIAGLGKFYSAIRKFTDSNVVKQLHYDIDKITQDSKELRSMYNQAIEANKELTAEIKALLHSDQFLENRKKADMSELKAMVSNLNELYARTLIPAKEEIIEDDRTHKEEA